MKIIIKKKDENFYTATLMEGTKFIISSGHETIKEIEEVFLPQCKIAFEREDIELIFSNENVDNKN